MDGNDDTTNIALIILGALVFLFLLFGCAKAGEDPTRQEIAEAAEVAGLKEPWNVWSIAHDKMPGSRLGTLIPRHRAILLEETWRTGGLTRLIHESVHARQLAGQDRPLTSQEECEASQIAASWADEHGFWNDAKRERSYGASYCVGE